MSYSGAWGKLTQVHGSVLNQMLFVALPPYAAVALFEMLHYDQFFFAYVAVLLILGVYLTYGGFSTRRVG